MRDYTFLSHSKYQNSNVCFSRIKFTLLKFIIRISRQWCVTWKKLKVSSKETNPFTKRRVSKQIRIYEHKSISILFGEKIQLYPFMHIPVYKLTLIGRVGIIGWISIFRNRRLRFMDTCYQEMLKSRLSDLFIHVFLFKMYENLLAIQRSF